LYELIGTSNYLSVIHADHCVSDGVAMVNSTRLCDASLNPGGLMMRRRRMA